MRVALTLARRGLGRVWPNPAVGCVLVRPADGSVLARGWTQPGGRPHAERVAIDRARARGHDLAGATAYVSLEPCSHHGRTPPCADALVEARVGRVVVALDDPDPRVDGGGLRRLREAGIEVVSGVLSDVAAEVNAGYLARVRDGRPLVTWKTATTLDGRTALADGDSKWITGEPARRYGHLLRAEHDAILVGSGTALTDDPALTCRLPGMEDRSPVRVVMDARLRLPPTAKLVRSARQVPTWLLTDAAHPTERLAPYAAAGVEVIGVPRNGDGLDPRPALGALAERGITRVLLEGGGTLATAFLRDELVDRIAWFRAPGVIGGDGRPAVAALGLGALDAMPRFRPVARRALGADELEMFARRA